MQIPVFRQRAKKSLFCLFGNRLRTDRVSLCYQWGLIALSKANNCSRIRLRTLLTGQQHPPGVLMVLVVTICKLWKAISSLEDGVDGVGLQW
jgi:hypothetical protein